VVRLINNRRVNTVLYDKFETKFEKVLHDAGLHAELSANRSDRHKFEHALRCWIGGFYRHSRNLQASGIGCRNTSEYARLTLQAGKWRLDDCRRENSRRENASSRLYPLAATAILSSRYRFESRKVTRLPAREERRREEGIKKVRRRQQR